MRHVIIKSPSQVRGIINLKKIEKFNSFGGRTGEYTNNSIVGSSHDSGAVTSVHSGNIVTLNGHTHPGMQPLEGTITGSLNPSGLIMYKFPTKANGYTFKVAANNRSNDMGTAERMPNAVHFIYAPCYNTTIIYNTETMIGAYEGKYKR